MTTVSPDKDEVERIGDLPERLFVHSLELVGDDEEVEPSALFSEIQVAAELLAAIRNRAGVEEAPTLSAMSDNLLSAADYYIAGLQAVQRKVRVRDLVDRHVRYDNARKAVRESLGRAEAAIAAMRGE